MEKQCLVNEIREMGDGPWYWISRRVFEDYASKIGVIGLALYSAYASYAREKGTAFPSQKVVSKKLGISIKTIIKYNKILAEARLIKIERGKGKSGTNLITLLKAESVKEGKDLKEGNTSTEPGSIEGLNLIQTKENNKKENTNVAEDSAVYDVISFFKDKVREIWGVKPVICWAKSFKLIKERLREFSLEEVKEIIVWFLESNHCERLGFSLSTCLSEYVINFWKKEILP